MADAVRPLHAWVDETRGGGPPIWTWHTKSLRVSLFQMHGDDTGTWLVNCRQLDVYQHPLQAKDLDGATREALDVVKRRATTYWCEVRDIETLRPTTGPVRWRRRPRQSAHVFVNDRTSCNRAKTINVAGLVECEINPATKLPYGPICPSCQKYAREMQEA